MCSYIRVELLAAAVVTALPFGPAWSEPGVLPLAAFMLHAAAYVLLAAGPFRNKEREQRYLKLARYGAANILGLCLVMLFHAAGPAWEQLQQDSGGLHRMQVTPRPVHVMYGLHLVWTLSEFVWDVLTLERKRKDYWLMMLHHPMTFLLVYFSYTGRYTLIGSYIMFLMHLSDLVLNSGLAALTHGSEKWGTALFLANLITWPYLRLYCMLKYVLATPQAVVAAGQGGTLWLMVLLYALTLMNGVWYAWMLKRFVREACHRKRGAPV